MTDASVPEVSFWLFTILGCVEIGTQLPALVEERQQVSDLLGKVLHHVDCCIQICLEGLVGFIVVVLQLMIATRCTLNNPVEVVS